MDRWIDDRSKVFAFALRPSLQKGSGCRMHFCSGGELFDLYQKCGSWAERRKAARSTQVLWFAYSRSERPIWYIFFAFRSSVIQQAQVVVVGVWSYESCKIPNFNASHHRAAPLSEDNAYGNCNFGADGDSEWGFIGRFLHVSSGPVLMTQGAFRVLFLLMLGCV